MTYKEKLRMEDPRSVDEDYIGGCCGCPSTYGYCSDDEKLCRIRNSYISDKICTECWNREMPETKLTNKKRNGRNIFRYKVRVDFTTDIVIDLDDVDITAVDSPIDYAFDLAKREIQSVLDDKYLSAEDFDYALTSIERSNENEKTNN